MAVETDYDEDLDEPTGDEFSEEDLWDALDAQVESAIVDVLEGEGT